MLFLVANSLLTTEEVAQLLRVHPKQVYRLLKRGLPARRVGAEWRFERDDVLGWAARTGAQATGSDGSGPRGGAAPLAPPLVAANGDVAVELLLRLARDRGEPVLGLVPADMGEGLALLRRRAVLAAGAHAGAFPPELDGERLARVHLVSREVGLVARAGREVPPLSALAGLRLVSRPPTAGVRAHLDAALAEAGLDPSAAHAGAILLASHAEVAAAVAAGRADVGLASAAWAARLGLAFRPLAREPYGLLVRASDLGDPRVVRLCEVAQSAAFALAAREVPGYDAAGAGDIRYDAA
ncbi:MULTISPECIES: helix-turn-helix transcriptional regulator [Anaeromyxobacter]|uniref:helix-turn-helix transcriptional regulator n=1 Tax=Anaeromyxobacter TaxID=161492 RepID=UPI001F5A273E|nr:MULTISPECIES: helix-turn-helix transcriptional regulator [unclassified Anaeromyxobacter]